MLQKTNTFQQISDLDLNTLYSKAFLFGKAEIQNSSQIGCTSILRHLDDNLVVFELEKEFQCFSILFRALEESLYSIDWSLVEASKSIMDFLTNLHIGTAQPKYHSPPTSQVDQNNKYYGLKIKVIQIILTLFECGGQVFQKANLENQIQQTKQYQVNYQISLKHNKIGEVVDDFRAFCQLKLAYELREQKIDIAIAKLASFNSEYKEFLTEQSCFRVYKQFDQIELNRIQHFMREKPSNVRTINQIRQFQGLILVELELEQPKSAGIPDLIVNRPSTVDQWLSLSTQLCQCLRELHQNNIVHGNINLSSFGLFDQKWKFNDIRFGLNQEMAFCEAPEILIGTSGKPSTATDFWAFAQVLIVLLIDQPLVNGSREDMRNWMYESIKDFDEEMGASLKRKLNETKIYPQALVKALVNLFSFVLKFKPEDRNFKEFSLNLSQWGCDQQFSTFNQGQFEKHLNDKNLFPEYQPNLYKPPLYYYHNIYQTKYKHNGKQIDVYVRNQLTLTKDQYEEIRLLEIMTELNHFPEIVSFYKLYQYDQYWIIVMEVPTDWIDVNGYHINRFSNLQYKLSTEAQFKCCAAKLKLKALKDVCLGIKNLREFFLEDSEILGQVGRIAICKDRLKLMHKQSINFFAMTRHPRARISACQREHSALQQLMNRELQYKQSNGDLIDKIKNLIMVIEIDDPKLNQFQELQQDQRTLSNFIALLDEIDGEENMAPQQGGQQQGLFLALSIKGGVAPKKIQRDYIDICLEQKIQVTKNYLEFLSKTLETQNSHLDQSGCFSTAISEGSNIRIEVL